MNVGVMISTTWIRRGFLEEVTFDLKLEGRMHSGHERMRLREGDNPEDRFVSTKAPKLEIKQQIIIFN